VEEEEEEEEELLLDTPLSSLVSDDRDSKSDRSDVPLLSQERRGGREIRTE